MLDDDFGNRVHARPRTHVGVHAILHAASDAQTPAQAADALWTRVHPQLRRAGADAILVIGWVERQLCCAVAAPASDGSVEFGVLL